MRTLTITDKKNEFTDLPTVSCPSSRSLGSERRAFRRCSGRRCSPSGWGTPAGRSEPPPSRLSARCRAESPPSLPGSRAPPYWTLGAEAAPSCQLTCLQNGTVEMKLDFKSWAYIKTCSHPPMSVLLCIYLTLHQSLMENSARHTLVIWSCAARTVPPIQY